MLLMILNVYQSFTCCLVSNFLLFVCDIFYVTGTNDSKGRKAISTAPQIIL